MLKLCLILAKVFSHLGNTSSDLKSCERMQNFIYFPNNGFWVSVYKRLIILDFVRSKCQGRSYLPRSGKNLLATYSSLLLLIYQINNNVKYWHMLTYILRGLQILCFELKSSNLDDPDCYYIITPGTELQLNSANANADNGVSNDYITKRCPDRGFGSSYQETQLNLKANS